MLAEQVMRKALQGSYGAFKIGGKTISNLMYADDIVLLAISPDELKELACPVDKAAKEYNLIISNDAKTKTVTNTNNMLQIKVKSGILVQVDCFVFYEAKYKRMQNAKVK